MHTENARDPGPQPVRCERVDLDQNTLSIGAGGGDLRILDPELSEIHAILARERDAFILRDLGSRTGTIGLPKFAATACRCADVFTGGYLQKRSFLMQLPHAGNVS